KFRELSSYLLTAQERERKRISFELHDELGQSLSVLKLKLGSIERGLGNHGARLRSDDVNVFKDIDLIIESIRRLSRDLSPALLEDLGLSGALRWMVEEFARHNSNRVFLAIEEINDSLSSEAQVIIYRIFQEALTNIGKHADAEQIFVRAEVRNQNVSLVMEDDGRGYDVNGPLPENPDERGFGLAAMEERARMLGASLEVQSRPGHGTRIGLTVPVENAKEIRGK
ncbi:MAG TPA: sensor histidine kinase, partial [Desulfobacteria bacterium]|nr:sensor histidine kinase [Desulfobacteria bacterium]